MRRTPRALVALCSLGLALVFVGTALIDLRLLMIVVGLFILLAALLLINVDTGADR